MNSTEEDYEEEEKHCKYCDACIPLAPFQQPCDHCPDASQSDWEERMLG